MPPSARYRPDPRYLALGDGFADVVAPARFPSHVLRHRDERWAARVGLDSLGDDEWERHFARFEPLPGNLPDPLALRYHGHQFGSYNPALGDGRGFLFAQLRDGFDGRLLDLGTKGSGATPYARGGDGRLTLKGGVREILAAELLAARGVDTCKILSVFETGERLIRGDEPSPTRSCVLVRLSHSNLRFGTFQRHAYHRDLARLGALVDYAVEHHFPAARRDDLAVTTAALVRLVACRAAATAAAWTVAGFVHGVLNTDNLNLTGESFDYGPWRFLPTYDLGFTAAYFDETGFYAFGRQPNAVLWNLGRLAEAVLPLTTRDVLEDSLGAFEPAFHAAVRRAFLDRLGLAPRGDAADDGVMDACYAFLAARRLDLDRFYFDWYGGEASAARALAGPAAAHYDHPEFMEVRRAWTAHAPAAPERLGHPYYGGAAPCSLLIDEVEALWAAIADRDDWAPLAAKLAAIREFATLHGRDPSVMDMP
ncbi:protein adenylyltransferase SelO family protein [Nannocystis bainbridge]|uniref:Protein nucleotidyltransferase YdiU n=1 Tax=Nannocystis bainbridge TaxID=2995303 RepID=A0ABT5E329_9BACT|nr:YdiU family protein [Nannocystis bainbridge]MDC0720277.1 YdiU family protein [Nannocystis bainbridge]